MSAPHFVRIGDDFINLNQVVRTYYTPERGSGTLKRAEMLIFFAVPRPVSQRDGCAVVIETDLVKMTLGGTFAEDFHAYLDDFAGDCGGSRTAPSERAKIAARAVAPLLAKQPGPAMSDPWQTPSINSIAMRIEESWKAAEQRGREEGGES